MEDRKKDHIELAFQSQTLQTQLDTRFHYEPMLAGHPSAGLAKIAFLGKHINVPIWVSSMTGGTQLAASVNRNLARACREFGMGMGLGSCRKLLVDDAFFGDFDQRNIIGDDLPFYANLGICQVEQLIENNDTEKIKDLVGRLRADGLIIHVNPMQEWFQPEGDHLKNPPIETIKRLLDEVSFPIIVKEVGQGIGPASLLELLKLPLAAIEFGAFGGTNFSKLELLRSGDASNELLAPLSLVGEDAGQMLYNINAICNTHEQLACKQLIISGGIHNFLDGYYLMQKSTLPAVYGQASMFLKFAKEGYEELRYFITQQIKGLEMAGTYLRVRG